MKKLSAHGQEGSLALIAFLFRGIMHEPGAEQSCSVHLDMNAELFHIHIKALFFLSSLLHSR